MKNGLEFSVYTPNLFHRDPTTVIKMQEILLHKGWPETSPSALG